MEWVAGMVLWSVAGTMWAMARSGKKAMEKIGAEKKERPIAAANQGKIGTDW